MLRLYSIITMTWFFSMVKDVKKMYKKGQKIEIKKPTLLSVYMWWTQMIYCRTPLLMD